MVLAATGLALLVAVTAGCSTSNSGTTNPPGSSADFEALFAPPAASVVTPNSVTGVWAGTGGPHGSLDVRLKISASTLVISMRCKGAPSAIGVVVAARVTATNIEIVESKSSGDAAACGIDAKPTKFDRTNGIGGFDVHDTSLNFEGSLFSANGGESPQQYKKLSD